jgi:creatinine amidohydrolase
MSDKVHYLHLRPSEFAARIAERAVGYLPMGTIEWHGPQNPLGGDALISGHLFERAARQFGGIVFPPLFFGPDRIQGDGETALNGMDFLYGRDDYSPQQLTGSCYWAPEGLFLLLLEQVIAQAKRAGFKALVADGHGPSRGTFCGYADRFEQQYDIVLIGARYKMEDGWRSQVDHAAKNETSLLMAAHPDDVDMSELPADPNQWPIGVGGEEPRESSPEHGEEIYDETVARIGRALENAGV